MRRTAGFSVLEMLLAATILLVILGLVSQGLQSSSGAVATVIADSELLDETRFAGQIIADRLTRALYIYPPGVSLTLSQSGYTSRNPRTANGTWLVGTDPILAFIEVPDNPVGLCSDSNTDACLKFVAYYPIQRSSFISGNSSFGKYLKDPRNDASWVIMEYRRNLSNIPEARLDSTIPPPIDSSIRGTSARILADFIVPDTGFRIVPDSLQCRSRDGSDDRRLAVNGTICKTLESSPVHYQNTVVGAVVELQAQYHKRQGVSATPVLSFPIVPRSLN